MLVTIEAVAEALTDLPLSDCHPGGGQHRPRTPQSDQRGAPSDALTRGRNKSSGGSGLRSRLWPFAAKHILISDKASNGSVRMIELVTSTLNDKGQDGEVRTQQKTGLK